MHIWRNDQIPATALLSGAAIFGATLNFFATIAAAEPTLTVAIAKPSVLVCPVSNPLPEPTTAGELPYLALQYDFHGADLGYSAFDTANGRMWFFFGDSMAADSVAWYGGGNVGGADATAYLDGPDALNPASLCNHLKMATVPGLVSSFGAGVWSPDLMSGPPSDPIGNYVFQGLPSNGGLPHYSTNSEIPGTDEVSSGSFFYRQAWGPHVGDALYPFYVGSPGWAINYDSHGNPQLPIGLPRPSVSYLSIWRNSSPQAPAYGRSPTNFDVLARVDYNLDNSDTTFCNKPIYPTTICPPTPPAAWVPTPPLGGHFIEIAPEMGDDGYLYLFGTGTYRASFVYLARLPAQSIALIGKCLSPPCYLAQTPGFQIWTTSVPNGTPHWSSAPPSAADIANAAPLQFADDSTPSYGELSVRHFKIPGGADIWLMMATSTNPDFRARVIARSAPSPTGKWSNALVAFDFSTDSAGLANESLYCCQGASTGKSDSNGPIWQCLGPKDGAAAQQCVECLDQSMSQSRGTPGLPRYGFYAPYMLPYPSDVSISFDDPAGAGRQVVSFNVNYLLSEFSPYNALLMQYRLQATVSP